MKELMLHQALHGYSNGHTLLQSSIRLSAESERIMLTMSDMSGPSMVPGFETYVSGYPLSAENSYVLARTWYAPEMPRPGCVWTHSLILGQSDTRQIRNVIALLDLFRRPKDTSRDYTRPVLFKDSSRRSAHSPSDSEQRALELVWALYGVPDRPVYMLARSSDVYESEVLRVWSQQWPDLRQNFSFCTGSIADRKLSGRSIDLQVVPETIAPQMRHELIRGTVFDQVEVLENSSVVTRWLTAAAKDLIFEDSSIRDYAWQLSSMGTGDRRTYPALIYIADLVKQLLNSEISSDDLVTEIAAVSSTLEVPAALKRAVLGPADSLPIELGVPEWVVLRSLAFRGDIGVLDPSELQIGERTLALWKKERVHALQLFNELIESQLTTMGEEILVGFCRAFDVQDALEVAQSRPGLLNMIVRQQPRLVLSSAVWSRTPISRSELFRTVMAADLSDCDLEQFVGMVLVSGDETIPNEAFRYEDKLVTPVLSYVNQQGGSSGDLVSHGWKRYLQNYSGSVVNWAIHAQLTPSGAALITMVLSPENKETLSADIDLWVRMCHLVPQLQGGAQVIVAGFLFAIALRTCDLRANELVISTFAITHDSGRLDKLPYQTWRAIEQVAPSLSWWRDWDKCERIRAALLDKFILCKWPRADLLNAVANPDTLRRLMGLYTTSTQRKEFLTQLVKDALQGLFPITPGQQEVIALFRKNHVSSI